MKEFPDIFDNSMDPLLMIAVAAFLYKVGSSVILDLIRELDPDHS